MKLPLKNHRLQGSHSTRWRRAPQVMCRQPPTLGSRMPKLHDLMAAFAAIVLILFSALLLVSHAQLLGKSKKSSGRPRRARCRT
jgi:hypothetical protein